MKKNICILFMFLAVYLSAFSNNQWEDAISQINEKSLPLVNIDVDVSSLTKANYINGKITIYDYENRVDGNKYNTFDCKIRYRGASSLLYEKKSFAIKLIDSEGENLDANFFEIRK